MTLTRTLLLCATLTAAAHAQTTAQTTTVQTTTTPSAPSLLQTGQSAAQAAADARDLIAKARSAYPAGSANIDQPLWKQAAAAAEAAVAAAPGNPEYLRLRAQIYTEVGFWRQAELSWNAYFRVAPSSGDAARQAATVQYNLGYAAYTRNQPDQAAGFFGNCLSLDPQNADCTTWAARTALEAGNYTQAQTLYDQALALKPGDATLTYFRALSQNAGKYGPAATRAFSRAYGDLQAGRQVQALAGFQQAAQAAPNFVEALREGGRLALQLGDARAAADAYTSLSKLPSPTAADAYNLALAQEGVQYGLSAVQAFRRAYALYAAGDKTRAEQGFADAAAQNADYAKAWMWLGRVRYEAKNYAGAADAYGKAVALNPADKTSAYYLRLAQQGK